MMFSKMLASAALALLTFNPVQVDPTPALQEPQKTYLTVAEATQPMLDAGVKKENIPALVEKINKGEVPDSLSPNAEPKAKRLRYSDGFIITTLEYNDGSATSFVADPVDDNTRIAHGGKGSAGFAAGTSGCKITKTSIRKHYTNCTAWAAYLSGKAYFKFDATTSYGTTRIDRVYGGSCAYFTSCDAPRIVRKQSSSSQHALAEMKVHATPVKGFAWSQHLIVRITNKGVMTAYPDYSYI